MTVNNFKKVFVHILLDGRDVSETSALEYVQPLEDLLAGYNKNSRQYKIASGGGRMITTMVLPTILPPGQIIQH